MTAPMSLQPWWRQIFILIQLRSQFFQMFVYGDVVYAQTWYWHWKTVSSHLHMPGRPMLLQYGPHFFSTVSQKFGQLARFFWTNGLPPPPPWQKISRTPMVTEPTWVAHSFQKTYTVLPYCPTQSFVDSGKWEATAVLQQGKEGRLFQCGTLLYIRLNRCYRDWTGHIAGN